jgi:Uma2 family endonuclease
MAISLARLGKTQADHRFTQTVKGNKRILSGIVGSFELLCSQVDAQGWRPYRTRMGGLTIELPPQRVQNAFNETRWQELQTDPELARFEGRVETDRYGHIIMTPPPAAQHGMYQSEIAFLLRNRTTGGRVLTECPISTADGVRAADVAWASPEIMQELGSRALFLRAPDVCVEVRSPSNSDAELQEKARLYFDAGAREVWVCAESGVMTFWRTIDLQPAAASTIFPAFPTRVALS